MALVNLLSNVKNITSKCEEKEECSGIKSSNKIIYKLNDSTNEIVFLKDKILFSKKRKDGIKMEFKFEKGKRTLILFKMKEGTLNIPLYTEDIIKTDKILKINYQVNDFEKFEFTLEFR